MFESQGTVNDDDTVTFNLKIEVVGEIKYFLKVTAEGGNEYWDEEEKTFNVYCGPASADII